MTSGIWICYHFGMPLSLWVESGLHMPWAGQPGNPHSLPVIASMGWMCVLTDALP